MTKSNHTMFQVTDKDNVSNKGNAIFLLKVHVQKCNTETTTGI